MSRTNLTRRGFFGHTAGAYAAVTIVSGTALAVTDPMLDCIRSYIAERDRLNSTPNLTDDELEYGFPLYDDLRDKLNFDPPPVTSEAGAIAALRLATEDLREAFGNTSLPLLDAALGFFERKTV